MTLALAPVAFRACSTVSKIGMPSKSVPPLPGTTPATIWVPYSRQARVWSWPVAPVIPWVTTRVSLLTRILIASAPLPDRFDHPPRGVGHVAGGDYRQSGVLQNLLALLDVGAFHAHHQRHLEIDLLGCLDHALGQHVAAHDAAEDVDQHGLDAAVGEQDAEGRRHLLGVGAAADVEKVGRLGPVILDDVHGRHRERCAVDHAADVA